MSDIQLNKRIAEVYDEFFVPALFAEWPARVLAAAAVQAGQRVLDVACGTGVLACAAAEQVGAQGLVSGVDVNAGMLAVAQQKAPAIDWQLGRAEDLPFHNAAFDAVVSQFGLMFFQDRPAAMREMLRVLRPGGHLAIAVWGMLAATPGYAAVVDLLRRLFGDQAADSLRAPYCLGDLALLRAELSAAGLPEADITTHTGTARFPSIRSWMFTDIKGWVLADLLDDQQFEQLVAAAQQELQQFVIADGSVAFPAPAHIITASKTHIANEA
jgi:SAM-dependent methyltransferase